MQVRQTCDPNGHQEERFGFAALAPTCQVTSRSSLVAALLGNHQTKTGFKVHGLECQFLGPLEKVRTRTAPLIVLRWATGVLWSAEHLCLNQHLSNAGGGIRHVQVVLWKYHSRHQAACGEQLSRPSFQNDC